MMRTVSLARLLLASAFAVGAVAAANALPVLRLTTSGGATATISDGGAGDANAATGAVTFVNGLGSDWFVNVTTGLSKPVLGAANSPELDINSINVSAMPGAGWLDIELTDIDFTPTTGALFLAAIGGTTAGSVSYQTYFDSGNTEFARTSALTSIGGIGPAFAATTYGVLSSAVTYSLTLVVRITHTGSPTIQSSSFDALLKVPEPGTLLLLGSGMLAFAIVARRRRGRTVSR
jgi:PEP-CTERM motif-containing protein